MRVDARCNAFAEREIGAAGASIVTRKLGRSAHRPRVMRNDFRSRKVSSCTIASSSRSNEPRNCRTASRPAFHVADLACSLKQRSAGPDPRSFENRTSRIPKTATGRNPSWARPLALFAYLAMARRRKSSGCRGRAPGARYSARASRARWPGGFCGSNRPPSCFDEACRPLRHTEIVVRRIVEIQGGKRAGYGDEAGDGANGTKRRPSHGCESMPSTIGARPAANGDSGVLAWPPPPPIVICVPFAGPECTLFCTLDRPERRRSRRVRLVDNAPASPCRSSSGPPCARRSPTS